MSCLHKRQPCPTSSQCHFLLITNIYYNYMQLLQGSIGTFKGKTPTNGHHLLIMQLFWHHYCVTMQLEFLCACENNKIGCMHIYSQEEVKRIKLHVVATEVSWGIPASSRHQSIMLKWLTVRHQYMMLDIVK